MIEFGVLLLVGGAIFVLFVIAAVMKTLFWLVLLPFRLLFWTVGGLLLLPLLLLKAVIGGVLLLVALPFLVLFALGAIAAAAAVILLPLLPFVLLFALLWYLMRDQPEALVRG